MLFVHSLLRLGFMDVMSCWRKGRKKPKKSKLEFVPVSLYEAARGHMYVCILYDQFTLVITTVYSDSLLYNNHKKHHIVGLPGNMQYWQISSTLLLLCDITSYRMKQVQNYAQLPGHAGHGKVTLSWRISNYTIYGNTPVLRYIV